MIKVSESKYSTIVKVDDLLICGITHETPIEAVKKFVSLCEAHEQQLKEICERVKVSCDWNFAHRESRKKKTDGFNEKEVLVNKLCKQAGIFDD